MLFLPRTEVGVLLFFLSLALSQDASQQLMARDELPALGWIPPVVDTLEGAASGFGAFASDGLAQLSELTKGVITPSSGSAGLDGLGSPVVDFLPSLPAPSLPALPPSPNLLPEIPPTTPPIPEAPDDPGAPKPAALPSLNTGCDQLPVGAPDDCDPRKSYIVYASSCTDEIGNEALTGTFTTQYQLNPDEIGRDDDCGIIFWVMRLSEDEAAKVRATPRVRDMVLNGPTVSAGVARPRGSTSVRSVEKRADEVVGEQSWYDLAFISTPPGAAVSEEYLSFASGGDGVDVYVMENGAASLNPEFDDKIKGWLYSNGVVPTPTDDNISGHGTCVASKVAGYIYGVAKATSLRICKCILQIDSFLRGLLLISNDLKKRSDNGESVRGHTVIMMTTTWLSDRTSNEQQLIKSLQKLMTKYQAVVVMASGNLVFDDDPAEITPETWPVAAYNDGLPIIIVGAVDLQGNGESYSRAGAGVNIYAPGEVHCAHGSDTDGIVQTGTSFAAAEVAGLVAYLLPIVPSLRGSDNIPREVLEYLKTKASYARATSSVRSVWNRLYPDREPPLHGWVP